MKKYDPTRYQFMLNGEVVEVHKASYDELVQAVCAHIEFLELIDAQTAGLRQMVDGWRDGHTPEEFGAEPNYDENV